MRLSPIRRPPEVRTRSTERRRRRSLGFIDQIVLWGNLGVSSAAAGGAAVRPRAARRPLSLAAALVAIVVGTVLGNVLLGLAAVPGAETGAPAMVLLRGLFGCARLVRPDRAQHGAARRLDDVRDLDHRRDGGRLTSDGWSRCSWSPPVPSPRSWRSARWASCAATSRGRGLACARLHRLPVRAGAAPRPAGLGEGPGTGFWQAPTSSSPCRCRGCRWPPTTAATPARARAAFGGAALGYATSSRRVLRARRPRRRRHPEPVDVIDVAARHPGRAGSPC